MNESADNLTGTGYKIASVTVAPTNALTISNDKTQVTGNMPVSNVTITFTYVPITVESGNAKIVKVDGGGNPLGGAEFTFAGEKVNRSK